MRYTTTDGPDEPLNAIQEGSLGRQNGNCCSIITLGANKHNMPTGHVAYVEKVVQADLPLYRIKE